MDQSNLATGTNIKVNRIKHYANYKELKCSRNFHKIF